MGGGMTFWEFVLDFWVNLGGWFSDLLLGAGWPAWSVNLVIDLIIIIILLVIGIVSVLVFTPMERKVIARMQDRPGPNRVGPYGLFQAFADAIKMLTKEDITPHRADRILHMAGPLLVAVPVLMVYAVLPFGPKVIGHDLNVGALYVVALGSITTLAVLMAGWGSNNKYALISAFRVVAVLLSYEIPIVLSLLAVVTATSSMSMQAIVQNQTIPYALVMPIAAFAFLISSMAEMGRSPVDMLEAESELVAGYHVEYSGMKFAMFFIAEYVNLFATTILIATLFLGGYRFFGLERVAPVLAPFIISAKAVVLIFVMLWFRATFPRFRIDHLLSFSWKFLVPLSLFNLMLVALVVKAVEGVWLQALVCLAGNLALAAIALLWLNRSARSSGNRALRAITAQEG
jgi:NADH-quinone oxidoreductase subunit H